MLKGSVDREAVIKTVYLHNIYDVKQFESTIRITVKKIKSFIKKNKIDSIAFTGHSGCAIAYPLSLRLKLPLTCIRKNPADSHYKSIIEGYTNPKKYIIVDDFIATGSTVTRIFNALGADCKCVGIFLYKVGDPPRTVFNKIKVFQSRF